MRAIRPLVGFTLVVVCLLSYGFARASADTQTLTCNSLTVSLSDDKNFYIFNAAATGDASTITGYTFDFGDHQSYRFTFNATSIQDHHTASVTHTYQTAGTYTATVHIDTKAQNKTGSVTSKACQTNVVISPPGSVLPETGAGNTVASFVIFSTVGSALHHFWARRYPAAKPNKN